ncbi:protein-disulfide reductase DsbD domain-containing protein [Enhydrobacter sp.]|jgi:thiol:disulfide interchange protein DsbD|uniref:protein-disulfide reductase DsbD family protein n=1 Tax=Enhydrobacter sp. TaxID=1894999 RepID=UPI002636838F|nr:protein-disulfide reductase DsbD domain-containing protein [Enhydrobacter sp.]WIM11549.1 MAG: Cytochrome c-type biogenesis protein DsbD, protein-disulfide reductase [Enhydrobacter sp.]
MSRLLAFLVSILLALPAAAQSVVTTDNVRAELVSEVAQVKPGEPFWVGLRETIRPHWHTYWKNPGDAGQPTDIRWKLPAGVGAGPVVWPAPTKIDVGGVVNYGFEGDILLLVKITPPADFAGSTLSLAADANWLVCSDVCIPEEGRFDLTLPVGTAAIPADPATRALFDAARRQVPTESPWPARFGLAASGDPVLVVDARGLKPDTIRDVYFFPAEWGPVANMAKQTAHVTADGIRIPLKKGDAKAAAPQQIAGTLTLNEKTGDGEHRQAFDIVARLDPAVTAGTAPPAESGEGEALSLWQALAFALLGGLILNLMPCVFPVLAMKAASFVRLAGHSRGEIRRDGIAYTAGVLASFSLMAATVLAIRSSFGEVSWGFQFQSPIFSLLIAYLFFVVGLNLSGVFEVGGRLAGVGQGLAGRGGIIGAFFTGVLAVIVATPCTAPFMAAALGFALSQPAPQTVGVLLAMGFGLALPYLALTFMPALQRLMPRPGAWMDRLRQLLAFPMYASAVWMVWVLTQQTGADGVLYALGGMVLIAFALWLLRLGAPASPAIWLHRGIATTAVLLAFAAALKLEDRPATAASASSGPAAGVSFDGWERFSRSRLAEAVAARKPVFVDFTAAWCITCLVNERVALETAATRRAFEQTGTVKLKGDWTNRDPEITATLKEHGRAGVPLYLYWAPGADRPKILPQILTEASVVATLTSNQQAQR